MDPVLFKNNNKTNNNKTISSVIFMELCFSNLLVFLGELTCSYSLSFRLNLHTFQNQSCVSRKSKIREWKKLNDSVLINYLITLFTTIGLK